MRLQERRESTTKQHHRPTLGNGKLPINVGCQNTDSQIQRDENGVALTGNQAFLEVDNGHDHGHHGGCDGRRD